MRISDQFLIISKSIEQIESQNTHVRVLGVSKTHSADMVREAYLAGISEFGENYVQEATSKITQLSDLAITWHFIGPIQSNKCRPIAEHFDWVQSVDRLKIAKKLDEAARAFDKELQILLQINIDGEETKSGLAPEELEDFIEALKGFTYLRLRGLMCIPKATYDKAKTHQSFKAMHRLYGELQLKQRGIDTLSMGMSGDYLDAIACGSNLVRLGTCLFGKR